jgi:hypothetical protein
MYDLQQLIRLGSHDEIIFVQSTNLMRSPIYTLLPTQIWNGAPNSECFDIVGRNFFSGTKNAFCRHSKKNFTKLRL